MTNKGQLQGSTIFVTGGSGGLGKAIAKLLVSRGIGALQEPLNAARAEILAARLAEDQEVNAVALDLSDYPKVKHAFISQPRTPDALYCAAGGNHGENGFFLDINDVQLDRCMKNNYYATLYPTKVLVDMWTENDKHNCKDSDQPKHRRVVFVSSAGAFLGLPGSIAYTPAKAAVRALADTLRMEFLRYSNPASTYTVHCAFPGDFVSPGFYLEQHTKTRLTKSMQGTDKPLEELEARFPSSDKMALLIITEVERGGFIICNDSWATSLLFTNMIGPSPKRGFGILDSIMGLLMGWIIYPVLRRRWEYMCKTDGHQWRRTWSTTGPEMPILGGRRHDTHRRSAGGEVHIQPTSMDARIEPLDSMQGPKNDFYCYDHRKTDCAADMRPQMYVASCAGENLPQPNDIGSHAMDHGCEKINGVEKTNGHDHVNSVTEHIVNPVEPGIEHQSPTASPLPGTSPSQVAHGAMPIAICGIGLRLPGGLAAPEQLWDFLIAKGNARCRVPESRYNVSAYYSASGKAGTVATEYGYFLHESVDLGALDTSFFTMARSEVEQADPQQRLMLEVARECFEDAGITGWRGRKIGCYVGNFGEDWSDMVAKETQPRGQYRIQGIGDYIVSNRISYEMDLRGPCMTVRTACSSGLVALNEACMAISRGDCEAALVGGVNLILAPSMTMAMTEQGVLSPDGSCKTFSADADGYARGEAITAIYVKPLAEAIRDGNPVRAVIRGTAHNFDGKTTGFSTPSADAQEAVIRRAYETAGITDINATAMMECHGTGTVNGDLIETEAVARVFGSQGIYIGSVKPNLGHSEGASGLVSIIKAVLALEHHTIPPNIGFTAPNPNIPFESAGLKVPLEPTAWPPNRADRVSISAFGIGGVNAHAILDSAAGSGVAPVCPARFVNRAQLLLFSAKSSQSLARMPVRFTEWVDKNPNQVENLAYTLALRREHLPHRCFALVDKNGTVGTVSAPIKPLAASQESPKVIMVFTGQGAQWPLMGRELLQSNAAFRASIQSLDQHLQTIKGENAPDYSIEDELLKPARKSRVNTASLSQPLCTAIQIALVDTLKSLGITPAAVVGHSSGEIAGAYAAGALTYGEAILIAHLRGKMVSTQKRAGSMAAVGMSWAATEKFLIPGVVIACDNSPTSVTISGDSEAVEAVMKGIRAVHPSALVRLLQVDKAYHSHHMSDVGDAYLDALLQHGVTGQTHTTTPIFSSVVGGVWQQPAALGAKYWRDNLESPVRFREAVISISGHDVGKHALFLEIGPHSALAGPLRQILSSVSSPAQYASAMVRNRDCLEGFLGTVGKIWSLHIPVRFETLLTGDKCLPDLPRYPWNHEGGSYWNESRLSKEWRQRRFARHELLGIRVPESSDIEPAWRNVFHLQDVPWVNDHRFGGDVVFPFAAYIAIAGEAVKQVSGVSEGFSIRNIIVSAALVFSDSKSCEILTTFKPCRITDSLKSQWWWEFTVASYNNQTWTQHCTGEVRPIALKTAGSAVDMKNTFPRRLVAQEWYDVIHRTGLELGPSFQTLHSLESSVDSSHQAMARVRAVAEPTESDYHIHPTIVDGALQSMYCAAVSGLARKVKAWLPFSIEQLEVTRCPSPISSDMMVETTAQTTSNLSLTGNTRCTSSQTVVFEASGIRMRLADDRTPQNADAAARYTWAPDASFVCIKDLVRPVAGRGSGTVLLEETAMDCVLSSVAQLQQVQPPSENLQRYASWIRTIASEQQKLSSNAESEIQVPAPDTHAQTGHDFANIPDVSAVAAAEHIRDSLVQIASGESLDKFVPHETMYSLANFIMHQVDPKPLIQCLAHSNPMLRVLEIVDERFPSLAGTAVNDLILPGSQAVRYSKYTVSVKGYMSDKDREEKSGKVDYVSLDISRDLADQNFEAHQYDLIIASGIAQAGDRSCLQRSLANIKRILVPGGRLLLQEINPTSIWANFVFGSQYGWWRSISPVSRSPRDVHTRDNSDDLPRRLEFELSEAGLGDVEVITSDSLSTTVVIKSTDSCSRPAQGTVTVLCLDHEGGAVDGSAVEKSVICQLRTTGYEVTRCVLGEEVPLNHDVVCLLDANGPFFDNPSPNNFEALKQLLTRLSTGCGGAAIFWPTLACQMGCRNPSYAPIIGFARTIRSEMLIDFATCEVDSFEGEVSSLIDVFGKFRDRRQPSSHSENGGSQDSPNLRPDFEYVVRDGKVNVGRFYPFALRDELMTSGPVKRAGVDTATPGRINSLQWEERPVDTMGSGDVEVEVYSAGLNFRDILVALGIVELPVRHFGVEGAGVITRIGSDVKAMNVGDRVLFLHRGCFVTSAIVPEHACARIPDKLSFDEAATMTFAFATAIYSLVNAGGLEKGQSVLIHSACGGVGLAAIQIAQMYGAQIYATVSSDEKVQFLMKNFAIPRSSILHSRDESFAPDIMRQTGGKGVDLVLNSLSGELLHATWSCVAPFGKMIEIGKRDLLGRGKLDMRPFLENRSYSCVDMDLLWTRPEVFKRCVRYIVELYEQGRIGPIQPFKIFSADSIQEAFRYMHQGQHIGRIGLAIRDRQGTSKVGTEVARKRRDVRFDTNASYVLIGGMGGIGRAVSRWMVEHGAGELIFLSRSAGTGPEDGAFAHELKSAGCRGVRLVPGDVTRSEDVARAVAAATLPLKGVIQLSMVLRDGAFENMTLDDWNAAAAPKIQGTWNIHNATLGLDLDFFVLFSSLSGAMGNRHQANYASANTFLDAFVQYRTGLGLAASAIGVGAVGDIGYISSNPQLLHRMKATGWEFTTEQQVLDAVTVAIAAPRRQNHGTEFVEMNVFVMGLGPTTQLNSPGNRAVWRDDRRMAVYHNARSMAAVAESGAAKGPAEAIRAFLRSSLADSSILTTDEAARFLGAEIGKQLSGLLLKSDQEEPNLSQPLIDLGLDSLVAIELRAWWKETLGFNISTLELLRASSLYALGQRAVAGLTVS